MPFTPCIVVRGKFTRTFVQHGYSPFKEG